MDPYWEDFDSILVDAVARGSDLFSMQEDGSSWPVIQLIADPNDFREWRITAEVDIDKSTSADRPIVALTAISRL